MPAEHATREAHFVLSYFREIQSANRDFWRVTGNPEVISSPVGLVPTNTLVVIDGTTPGQSANRKRGSGKHRFLCAISGRPIPNSTRNSTT